MTSSNGLVASTSWILNPFKERWYNNKNKDILGNYLSFGLSRFELFYNPVDLWENDKFGIILKELVGKRPLKVNLKLWFENKEKQKFQESVQKHIFNKEGDCCKFNLKLSDAEHIPLFNVFSKNEYLYICCEITELNAQATVLETGCTQQLHQGMSLMYAQGVHDAVIKVGDTEFKIMKSQFIACSEVFKSMFTLGFKESKTNTVEIKDVSEQTMDQLIKWMYTCQISNHDSIEDLFEAADKYQIHLLKTQCVKLLINSLDNSKVFRRLILAVTHQDNQLKESVLKYIDKMPNMEIVAYLTSPEWFELAQKKSIFVEEVNKLVNDKLKK